MLDSECEVLLPDSVPSSPVGQPSLPLDPPCPLNTTEEDSPLSPVTSHTQSTPLLRVVQPSPKSTTSISKVRSDIVSSNSSLPNSGSRHSLGHSKETPQNNKRKEAKRQRSAQLPAHGEVQKMEHRLLKLLNEFNSGQLRAFDSAYSLEQMESVRDQQEAIARSHFELGAEQDLHPPLSDDGLNIANENMGKLMGSLEKLSLAIGQLSCLDRMVERTVISGQQGDILVSEKEEGSNMSGEATQDTNISGEAAQDTNNSGETGQGSHMSGEAGPLLISRRSTASSRAEAADNEEYLDRLSLRTAV